MSQNKTIFITSGGTGGHIIPARCLADNLEKQGHKVFFLGDVKYENYITSDDKFVSKIISCAQIKKKIPALVLAAFKIGFGVLQSMALMIKYRPQAVVAFGGYATFPVLIAAVMTRNRIILHEQNAHLGKVNRLFAKYANKIATSFHKTSGILEEYSSKVTYVGNLVRDEILELSKIAYRFPDPNQPKSNKSYDKMGYDILLSSELKDLEEELEKDDEGEENFFNILVVGGSGGAQIFSEVLPKAFFNLTDGFKGKINVFQQCRANLAKSTYDQYKSFNLNAEIQPFFSDMPEKIKEAHLVIARAGSSSIFEFCAAKKPMILIPFEKSADNHQQKNAQFIEDNGAAIVIQEQDFTINNINKTVKKLVNNPVLLKKMSQLASSLVNFNATQDLAKMVIND